MKHIFMGKVNSKFYLCKYTEKEFKFPFSIKSLDDLKKYYKDIDDIWVDKRTYTKGYEIIKETDEIQERVLESSKVKINNEELHIEKVVQSDNGDVICYTDKIVREIEVDKNDETKKLAEDIIDEYKKMKEQKQQNKKWWQFWR